MALGFLGRKKKALPSVQTVPTIRNQSSVLSGFEAQTECERGLYSSLREAVPVIDAALSKLVRLMGGFKIVAEDKSAQHLLNELMSDVVTNGGSLGAGSFVSAYLDSLLTYGEAVGEMVIDNNKVVGLYNAGLEDVEIKADKSPLELVVYTKGSGYIEPVKYQQLVFASLLNPKPGTIKGTSILSGLPFVSGVLLRIFKALKNNWERVGDVRFAVTYTPQNGQTFTSESAAVIADEWKRAMRSDSVCDFVALGDVSIKVIGAESQMPDCDVPVRHIMEQIVAKLGIPPFLLGLSWSSTERMSEQQADILTSELEYYRRVLEPVIMKIAKMQLRLSGYTCGVKVEWDDINLQDAVELSQVRLNNANALKLERELGMEEDT